MLRILRVSSLSVVALLITSQTVEAHNLFVLIESQASGDDLVDVIFEHFPYPGKGTYNQPHLDRGKTWVQQLGSADKIQLKLTEQTRLGKKFLQTKTDTKQPRAIVHTCKWGVYNGRLDFFHGKYLDVRSRKEAAEVARTPDLPLDLVPSFQGDKLVITVLYQGKALGKTNVSIWAPGSKETKQKTDANGTITVASPKQGTWSFATAHTLKDPSGEFQGEAYKGVMHGSSVSLRLPLK